MGRVCRIGTNVVLFVSHRASEEDSDCPRMVAGFLTSSTSVLIDLGDLIALTGNGDLNTDFSSNVKKVDQWMKFNKGINEYEEEPYQTWVATVYSKIRVILDRV